MYKRILATMESRFRLDLGYFISNSAFTVANQIVDAFLALVITFFLSHLTDKSTFGNYYLVISILALASITSIPGLTTSLTRSVALGFEGDYTHSLVTSLKYSLFGSFLLFLLSIYFFAVNQQQVFVSLLLSSVFFPLIYSFNNCWSGLLIGRKLFKIGFLYSVASSVVLLSITGTAIFLKADTVTLVLAFLIGTATPNAIIFFHLKKSLKNALKNFETKDYAVFITKANIITQLSMQIDQLSLGFFLNPISVANYRVASSLTNVLRNLEKSAANILVPKIVEQPETEVKNKIISVLPFVMFFSSITLIIFAIFQPYLVPLLFSNKYSDIIFSSQLILVSLALTPIELIFYQFFAAKKKTAQILAVNTFIPIFKIMVTVIGLAFWGFNGVVFSNIAARLFNAGFYLALFRKA